MSLRDDLNALCPRLRRYARALASGHPGENDVADDMVHATLMRALGARHVGSNADLSVRLYATVTQLHREMIAAGRPAMTATGGRPVLVVAPTATPAMRHNKLSAALLSLTTEEREALLLVAVERFDHATAARILRVSRPVLLNRLSQARTNLDTHLKRRPWPVEARERAASHLRLVQSSSR